MMPYHAPDGHNAGKGSYQNEWAVVDARGYDLPEVTTHPSEAEAEAYAAELRDTDTDAVYVVPVQKGSYK